MKSQHAVLLTLALAGAAVAGPVKPRLRLPVQAPSSGDQAGRLAALIPVEPAELAAGPVGSRPVRQSQGFVQQPDFAQGSALPDAPQNGEIGFFQMPLGFPSMGGLGGFSDTFDSSRTDAIEVIPIAFPESSFQSRQDNRAPDRS